MPRGQHAVIIGAGITGTLTARELARAGWAVTLLEAEHVGAGSSSRTAAGIRQQWSTPDSVKGMRYAVRVYTDWAAQTGGLDSPIRQNGYLFLSDTHEGFAKMQHRVRMQQDVGLVEVEALGATDLVRKFPWVSEETIVGGTFCPTDGFLLPSMVYQDGLADAKRHGAVLRSGSPVTGAAVTGGRITGVHTPKGLVEGDVFIDCTNAWTRALARNLGAYELPVDPLKRYLWFIQRDGPMGAETLAQMPMTITPSGVYCRPENSDTLMMGHAHPTRSEDGFTYEDQDVIEPDFAHTGGLEAAPFESWALLSESVPDVGEFGGVVATTSGYYGTTPDHNPFFGFDPVYSNYLRLVGFSGHGAMFGPFTARVALALCEAGGNLESFDLDGDSVGLTAFALERHFLRHEAMVI